MNFSTISAIFLLCLAPAWAQPQNEPSPPVLLGRDFELDEFYYGHADLTTGQFNRVRDLLFPRMKISIRHDRPGAGRTMHVDEAAASDFILYNIACQFIMKALREADSFNKYHSTAKRRLYCDFDACLAAAGLIVQSYQSGRPPDGGVGTETIGKTPNAPSPLSRYDYKPLKTETGQELPSVIIWESFLHDDEGIWDGKIWWISVLIGETGNGASYATFSLTLPSTVRLLLSDQTYWPGDKKEAEGSIPVTMCATYNISSESWRFDRLLPGQIKEIHLLPYPAMDIDVSPSFDIHDTPAK